MEHQQEVIGSRSIRVGSDDLECPCKAELRGVGFFRRISVIMLVPFDIERPPLARWRMWGAAYSYEVSHAPSQRSPEPQRSQKFWTLAYAHTVWRRAIKFGT